MGFGSLGFSELAVIFIIVLVFFGPRRFPEIARSMGSAMREFRRSLNQIQRELEEVDPRKDIPGKDILDEIRTGKPSDWLDPNKSRAEPSPTPGARVAPETSEPQVTGEAMATAAAAASAPAWTPTTTVTETPKPSPPVPTEPQDAEGNADEQLPMFGGGTEEEESGGEPTGGSRSDSA